MNRRFEMVSLADVAVLDATSIVLLVATIVVFTIPIFILFPPVPVDRTDALQQTHSKLGVPSGESNLRTQTRADLHQPKPDQPGKIQSLHIYPIKSCKGIELKEVKVTTKGFDLDRRFCFAQLKSSGAADSKQWEVITLRQLALMANIAVDVWLPDKEKTSRQLGHVEGGFVVVRFPWKDAGVWGFVQAVATKLSYGLSAVPRKEFWLPLEFPDVEEVKLRGYHYCDVKLFRKSIRVLNMSSEVPPELGRYLGAKDQVGLFRMDPTLQREVFDCAPMKEDIGYQPVVDFQDQYPLHMASLTSVYDLQSNIQKDDNIQHLDIRRFRPNIILSGMPQWDEDDWKKVRFDNAQGKEVSSALFDVSCRTVRCKLPNVDPTTGIRHKVEPDRTLRKHREIDVGAPKKGCFGMQLCPILEESDNFETALQVGMTVNVLERGEHCAK